MVKLTRQEICSFGDVETAYKQIVKMAQEEVEIEEFIQKLNETHVKNEQLKRLQKQRQYDAERYQQHRETYIQNALKHKKELKDDIPRMRQKILKELGEGKRIWLSAKTMNKYGITQDKTTKTYA